MGGFVRWPFNKAFKYFFGISGGALNPGLASQLGKEWAATEGIFFQRIYGFPILNVVLAPDRPFYGRSFVMKILFMCVANSARSQLAEGLAKEFFKDAEVESAGSKPGTINPLAVAVMKEIQIDISSQFSKSCDDLEPSFLNDLDYIITLCAEEVCPILVSKAHKLHWPIKDPAGFDSESLEYRMEKFREARDILKGKLANFSKEVGC